MIMKKILYSILCLLIISTVACSSTKSKIEKNFLLKEAPCQGKGLVTLNHHVWRSKKIIIEYDFKIDDKTDTITYDGVIKINYDEKPIAHLLRINYISFYFLYINSDKIVINVEERTINPFKNLSEPVPFNVSTPYNSDFKEVIVIPSYYASGII